MVVDDRCPFFRLYCVFTRPDTASGTIKLALKNRVEMLLLHKGRHQHRFPLGPVPILSVSVSTSVLASGSVNARSEYDDAYISVSWQCALTVHR